MTILTFLLLIINILSLSASTSSAILNNEYDSIHKSEKSENSYILPFSNDQNNKNLNNKLSTMEYGDNYYKNKIEKKGSSKDLSSSSSSDYYTNSENFNSNKRDWNYLENSQEITLPEKQIKTMNLQILDDPYYIRGRPEWPHEEYLHYHHHYYPHGQGHYNQHYTNNESESESGASEDKKEYHWQQLPSYGPGYTYFKDKNKNKKYRDEGLSLYNNKKYDEYENEKWGYNYKYNSHSPSNIKSHLDNKIVNEQTNLQLDSDQIGDKKDYDPSNRHHHHHHGIPHHPHHHHHLDHYKRKRFRFEILPSYLAAPLAAGAAFALTHTLVKKPLLFELGLVNHDKLHHHHHPHYHFPNYHPLPGAGYGPIPGHVGIHPHGGHGGIGHHGHLPLESTTTGSATQYPILNPKYNSHSHNQLNENYDDNSIAGSYSYKQDQNYYSNYDPTQSNNQPQKLNIKYQHQNQKYGEINKNPDDQSSSWWNSFTSYIPKL